MVQRRGRQVHGAGPDSVGRGQELVARRQLLDRFRWGGAPHALGSPGRPRRVEERNALDPFVARGLARPGTEDVAGIEVDPVTLSSSRRRDDHGPVRRVHHRAPQSEMMWRTSWRSAGSTPACSGTGVRRTPGEEVDPILRAERTVTPLAGRDPTDRRPRRRRGRSRPRWRTRPVRPRLPDHDGGVVGPVRSVVSGVGHVQSAAAEPMRSTAISRCSSARRIRWVRAGGDPGRGRRGCGHGPSTRFRSGMPTAPSRRGSPRSRQLVAVDPHAGPGPPRSQAGPRCCCSSSSRNPSLRARRPCRTWRS